jgi:hypothetical protein
MLHGIEWHFLPFDAIISAMEMYHAEYEHFIA